MCHAKEENQFMFCCELDVRILFSLFLDVFYCLIPLENPLVCFKT